MPSINLHAAWHVYKQSTYALSEDSFYYCSRTKARNQVQHLQDIQHKLIYADVEYFGLPHKRIMSNFVHNMISDSYIQQQDQTLTSIKLIVILTFSLIQSVYEIQILMHPYTQTDVLYSHTLYSYRNAILLQFFHVATESEPPLTIDIETNQSSCMWLPFPVFPKSQLMDSINPRM